MRAFLAFEVSREIVENLLAVEEELRRSRADLKLVERENLHFTVKFLGDIPDAAVAEIDARIRELLLPKVEVRVRGLGAFPNPRRPRVIWAGVSGEDEVKLSASASTVIETLEGIGKPEDHAFHPHITVARVRSPRGSEALDQIIRRNSDRDFGRVLISSLKLKSSFLTPKGPIYTDVREYGLQ